MPGFDRSGPVGAGPLTGRQQGRCNPATRGNAAPLWNDYRFGRGLGLRRGFRRGFGPGRGMGYGLSRGWRQPVAADAPTAAENELQMLKANAENMLKSLEAMRDRINTLEKDA